MAKRFSIKKERGFCAWCGSTTEVRGDEDVSFDGDLMYQEMNCTNEKCFKHSVEVYRYNFVTTKKRSY
jgi:hypothetical protein